MLKFLKGGIRDDSAAVAIQLHEAYHYVLLSFAKLRHTSALGLRKQKACQVPGNLQTTCEGVWHS